MIQNDHLTLNLNPPAVTCVAMQVPENLIQIRAFIRWEEAGKPENMPPEWQQVSWHYSA